MLFGDYLKEKAPKITDQFQTELNQEQIKDFPALKMLIHLTGQTVLVENLVAYEQKYDEVGALR